MAFVLGVTGTIGSGKTAVAQMLREIGEKRWGADSVEVIDADAIAKKVVEPGTEALKEIIREFGPGILHEDGRLNRRGLAGIVFKDRGRLAALNAIIHPRVRAAELERIRKAQGKRLIVLDVPLLFETGMETLMNKVMVVTVGEAKRFGRLKGRGLREPDVIARLRTQMPQSRKVAKADAVADNSGEPEATRKQIEGWLDRWTSEGL